MQLARLHSTLCALLRALSTFEAAFAMIRASITLDLTMTQPIGESLSFGLGPGPHTAHPSGPAVAWRPRPSPSAPPAGTSDGENERGCTAIAGSRSRSAVPPSIAYLVFQVTFTLL